MNITTESLQAFLEIIKFESFTKAALHLGLTQSALSQKMKRLEDQLETTLFVRLGKSFKLTFAGEKLVSFAQDQLKHEEEFLQEFLSGKNELKGVIRIASFSSVLRSLIIPKLAPILREHRGLSVEFQKYEVIELIDVLKKNRADIIITDYFSHSPGVIESQIGIEEYVVIESVKNKCPKNIYLDHGPHDNATETFFNFQGQDRPQYRRAFMGDVYGILDGVYEGLGRAVMSRHLIVGDKRFKMIKGYKKYTRPLVLCQNEQAFYPKHYKLLVENLKLGL